MSLNRPFESRTAYSFFPDELRCVVLFAVCSLPWGVASNSLAYISGCAAHAEDAVDGRDDTDIIHYYKTTVKANSSHQAPRARTVLYHEKPA